MHLAPTSSTVNTLMMATRWRWQSCRRVVLMKKILHLPPSRGTGRSLAEQSASSYARDDAIPQVALTASVMDAMLDLAAPV